MKNDINDPKFRDGGPSAAYAFERNRLTHLGESPEVAHAAGVRAHLAPFNNDGIGAPGHETSNHFAALLRYEGREAHDKAVRELFKRDRKKALELGLVEPPRLSA